MRSGRLSCSDDVSRTTGALSLTGPIVRPDKVMVTTLLLGIEFVPPVVITMDEYAALSSTNAAVPATNGTLQLNNGICDVPKKPLS